MKDREIVGCFFVTLFVLCFLFLIGEVIAFQGSRDCIFITLPLSWMFISFLGIKVCLGEGE